MSDVFRRVTIYKDGSISVDDERGAEIEGDDKPKWFTREDLDAIDEWIGDIYQIQGEWGIGSLPADDPELLKAQSLRARIESLLPPTEDQ